MISKIIKSTYTYCIGYIHYRQRSPRAGDVTDREATPMDMILNLLKALATIVSTVKTLFELYDRWKERQRDNG